MSKIQWTDETWNPVIGCSKISPGCKNCYAAETAKQPRLQQFPQYQEVKDWDGTVTFVESQLLKPLSWRSPKKIFVCSMGDLFHENMEFEWIDKIFAVITLCRQHTFQVLTKRPKRMLKYLSENVQEIEVNLSWIWDDLVFSNSPLVNKFDSDWVNEQVTELTWPLPNVWIGTSVENQQVAQERIPLLLQTPAAVRFLSCEPLLENIDLTQWLTGNPKPDWVICGGESGSSARPCHLDWLLKLAAQCQSAEVAVFLKQLGSNPINSKPYISGVADVHYYLKLKDRKGGNIDEFPDELKVREFPKERVCKS